MTKGKNRFGYWNGSIVPLEEISISPYDLGVLRGYGVFDVMRTENKKPFLLERHWDRFTNSAETLGLTIPVSKDEYIDILSDLIERNGFDQANIRTVLTGGMSSNAFVPEGNEAFFILIEPFAPLDNTYFSDGSKVMTLDFKRDFPRAKITQYITAIKNTNQKKKVGALEILYVRDGKALEASTSNYALFLGNTLVAPKDEILLGITRGLVLQLAQELGFQVDEREVSFEEVLGADEMFLTATNKYIVPVVQVDEHVIGSGKPGEKTKKLMQKLQEFIREY